MVTKFLGGDGSPPRLEFDNQVLDHDEEESGVAGFLAECDQGVELIFHKDVWLVCGRSGLVTETVLLFSLLLHN